MGFRGTIMRGKMYRWIAIHHISQIVMVLLALFLAENFNDKKIDGNLIVTVKVGIHFVDLNDKS